MGFELLITSALLGAGLAMDAFSVAIADALADSNMSSSKKLYTAGTFAGFQFAMPMAGWLLVTAAREIFKGLSPFIPWIALILLVIIGIGLIKDGIKERAGDSASDKTEESASNLGFAALMLQGVATSIDALSVGFTTASYSASEALASSLVIGAVTFLICMLGLSFGRRLAPLLKGRATIAGGILLIAIGIEIWAKGVFF